MFAGFGAKSWVMFILQIALIIALIIVIIGLYGRLRALFKRLSLVKKIKKICKEKGYSCKFKSVYSSVFHKNTEPELILTAGAATYAIKFFACLKYKDTYTLTDLNSYMTANNNNPIMLSFGRPSTGLVMKTPSEKRMFLSGIVKTNDHYVKSESSGKDVIFPENAVRILCINPLSVEVRVVRTNRPERVFDGESFKECTVYSGKGLCGFIQSMA